MNCTKCGAEMEASTVFCTACGSRVGQAPSTPVAPPSGYQQPPQGGYQPAQGGYQQPPQGGYQQPPQGGYQPGYPPHRPGQMGGGLGVSAARKAFGSPVFMIYIIAFWVQLLMGWFSISSLASSFLGGETAVLYLFYTALPLAWAICGLVLMVSAKATDNRPIKCLGAFQGLSVTYLVFICILTAITAIAGLFATNNSIVYYLKRYLNLDTSFITIIFLLIIAFEVMYIVLYAAQASFFRNAKNAALMGTHPVKASGYVIVMYFIGAAGCLISVFVTMAMPYTSGYLIFSTICGLATAVTFPITLMQYNRALMPPMGRPNMPNTPPSAPPTNYPPTY